MRAERARVDTEQGAPTVGCAAALDRDKHSFIGIEHATPVTPEGEAAAHSPTQSADDAQPQPDSAKADSGGELGSRSPIVQVEPPAPAPDVEMQAAPQSDADAEAAKFKASGKRKAESWKDDVACAAKAKAKEKARPKQAPASASLEIEAEI